MQALATLRRLALAILLVQARAGPLPHSEALPPVPLPTALHRCLRCHLAAIS